jgi:23S rRNA (cytosine1962-C5)-methyltransferase
MAVVTLQPGRDGPVRAGHPWVFSRAIASGLDGLEPGEVVRVHDAGGRFVAWGYANAKTSIAVRVLTRDDEPIDAGFVARRVGEAAALREAVLPPELTAYRVINDAGDRLPGVVVDRYGDFLVCQLLTAGAAKLAPQLTAALKARFSPRGIYERSEGGVRAEEGLGGARGVLAGEEPPDRVIIDEAGLRFVVDLKRGQKTGFFLDQREGRARARALGRGRSVLNAFAYTGGFGIAAAAGGARRVVSVDTSRPALELGELAWAENGLAPAAAEWIEGDVFEYLRIVDERFDLIVLDPPPFVRRRRDHDSGLRGYKDVNLQAFRRLLPGGWLLTSSCSQHVSAEEFRRVVTTAAADAGRVPTVVAAWGHGPDHPTLLAHAEGEYLKSLLVRA